MISAPLCIPGFLGVPRDFDWLKAPHTTVDLFSGELYANSLEDCGQKIVDHCVARGTNSLIGYSLGGRLALQALCIAPKYFNKAIIFCAHTGLKTDEERTARVRSDKVRAESFQNDPWNQVISEWDAQTVLRGIAPKRNEPDYNRDLLAHALTGWSLGKQPSFLPQLESVTTETLWITGVRDEKFTAIAQTASQTMPNAIHIIIQNAGHRVLWEAEDELNEIVTSFLKK